MAVRKLWTIDHACGHTAEADLSERPADRRAGYARWLSRRDCTACWQAGRDMNTPASAEWVEQKRAVEQAATDAWAERYRMPPLEGTDRGVAWGARCRHQLLSAAYTALVVEGAMSASEWELLEDAVRPLTRAGWWIDQREAEPTDLPELVEAAAESDRPTENPFF
ncbi:hypothetical protein [Streptomyces sp. G1]|uniref:hypothetical protein n=1 Tax=Streptomyces sp. G1 TaxID=361572 RepID=UPI00203056A1|nr:hypothetical protein [Streptomyces sp. G1]MCM1967972.1 hypothetical protein [Streptomyces sp. G1]